MCVPRMLRHSGLGLWAGGLVLGSVVDGGEVGMWVRWDCVPTIHWRRQGRRSDFQRVQRLGVCDIELVWVVVEGVL